MSYKSFINLSNQFKFCGNAFRIDTHKGCSFGCSYCYANNSVACNHEFSFDSVDIEDLDKLFYTALETSRGDSIVFELLRNRVPLHCGSMADPFQVQEFTLERTLHLIQLSVKYRYPICFSTKTSYLPEKYFDALDPELHAFQISIIGADTDWCAKFEQGTRSPLERVDFVRTLREKGFWCSIRIQPLIDAKQALKLVELASGTPSYLTVEHLKIPQTNLDFLTRFRADIPNVEMFRKTTIYYELPTHVKVENIKQIQKAANANGVLVGVGDNDLHELSQSRCCCGIDCIPSFSSYLKYNSTYMLTGDDNNFGFIPNANCQGCLNSDLRKKFPNKVITFKEVVDDYISRYNISVGHNKKRKLF